MKLKSTLSDYTEPEFQALVDRIWAVDMPKADHDRLINHFDQIAGHPQGADLLFYPPRDEFDNVYQADTVVYFVKDWHQQQGRAAFKGQAMPAANLSHARPNAPFDWTHITQQRVAQNLADIKTFSTDMSIAEQQVQAALAVLEQSFKHLLEQQGSQSGVDESAASIRALEAAEFGARSAVRRFVTLQLRIKFARDGARSDVVHAQTLHAQWQGIAQQLSTIYDSSIAKVNVFNQHLANVQSELLLATAQSRLVDLRRQTGGDPARLFAPLAFVDARPAILVEDALSPSLENHRVDLQKAIRSAVAEFTWQVTSGDAVHQGQYAAILEFDFFSRAESGLYGICLPVSEFIPVEGVDWQYLSATRAEKDLPFRMSSGTCSVPTRRLSRSLREIKTLQQALITPTNGSAISPGVRVRSAAWNEDSQTYDFTSDGASAVSVSWSTPTPLDTAVSFTPDVENRLEFVQSSAVPSLENVQDLSTVSFDDYVVVFPEGSGLAPLYLMFRDPRDAAGQSLIPEAPIALPETR